jgi:hypothetical protein
MFVYFVLCLQVLHLWKEENMGALFGRCVTRQKVTMIGVNATAFRVSFFVLLFSLAITFLHSCGGNISIIVVRNAWVGYFVYLCVMED